MKFTEPQISLFQSIPIDKVSEKEWKLKGRDKEYLPYRISTMPMNATFPETRFICRFHSHEDSTSVAEEMITFSKFRFNYEYVMWRKKKLPMMLPPGTKDVSKYEMSQLIMLCPLPQKIVSRYYEDNSNNKYHNKTATSTATLGGHSKKKGKTVTDTTRFTSIKKEDRQLHHN
jgi:hypothetical protein